MKQRALAVLFTMALAFVCARESAAAQRQLYDLELTNKSGTAIREVVFTPVIPRRNTSLDTKIADPSPHAVKTTIAPGAKAIVTRPGEEFLQIVIAHDKGTYTFPLVSFYEKTTAWATLGMEKPDIPKLAFFDEEKNLEMDLAGNNSAWAFTQILGGFPFGVGATTLAEAKAKGAAAGAEKNELKITQLWDGSKWNVVMRFAGDAPESVLEYLSMSFKESGLDNMSQMMDGTLQDNGYAAYRVDCKGTLDLYALPEEEEAKAAAHEAFWNDKNGYVLGMTTFYAPAAFANALAEAAKKGQGVRPVFEKNGQTVIVLFTEKDGRYTITMVSASSLAAKEK